MRKLLKRIIPLLLCAALVLLTAPARTAYTPPVNTFKVGLEYGSSVAGAMYLQTASGYGDGFRFGYYNNSREFVRIGSTSSKYLAVLKDVTMYGNSSGKYSTSSSNGSIVVGSFHIQMDKEYPSYSAARTAADTFSSVEAFVKYDHGNYYVCAGDYTSSSAAKKAAESLNLASSYTITEGTAYTVTLVEGNTGKILFEFDWGTTYYLGIEPYSNSGVRTQTWHAGYRYPGGFEFGRFSGGNLTCINYVSVEDYTKGVVPNEMYGSWPREALKAQAVCARTYAMTHMTNHKSAGFDLCTATHCQVYRGIERTTANSDAAVDESAGEYLTYKGKLCETYFFDNDGGATESMENVWSGSRDYLKGTIDPYEAAVASSISNYNWSVTFTGSELASKLKSAGYSCTSPIVNAYVSEYTPTGNVMHLHFVDSNGKTITVSRSACRSVMGLRSQRFKIYNKGSNGALIDTSPVAGQIYVNDGGVLEGELSSSYAIGSGGTVSQLDSGTVYAITGKGDIQQVTAGSGTVSKPVSDTFVVSGSGWGHLVGLSQWGAYSMAKNYDMTYKEILGFYFKGSEIG